MLASIPILLNKIKKLKKWGQNLEDSQPHHRRSNQVFGFVIQNGEQLETKQEAKNIYRLHFYNEQKCSLVEVRLCMQKEDKVNRIIFKTSLKANFGRFI